MSAATSEAYFSSPELWTIVAPDDAVDLDAVASALLGREALDADVVVVRIPVSAGARLRVKVGFDFVLPLVLEEGRPAARRDWLVGRGALASVRRWHLVLPDATSRS